MQESKHNLSEFVVCINNSDYPASLELHKIYRVIADKQAEDADMFVELRKSDNIDIGLFYSPFYSPDSSISDNNDWESYKIQSIKVTFNRNSEKP